MSSNIRKFLEISQVSFLLTCMLLVQLQFINSTLLTLSSSVLYLEITEMYLTPPNGTLETKIREEFKEKSVIDFSGTTDVAIRLIVTCFGTCPVQWTFDNMQFMTDSGPVPHVFPFRNWTTEANGDGYEFGSNLIFDAQISNQTILYSRRASLLTGKYLCSCGKSYTTTFSSKVDNNYIGDGENIEKYFNAFFLSDTKNIFVNAAVVVSVRPNPGDEWTGLGCATQKPNVSISLWKKGKKYWHLLEPGDKVKRDESQGFLVATAEESDVNSPIKFDEYKCTEDSTDTSVWSLAHRISNDSRLLPTLTFNSGQNAYECCLDYADNRAPAASFISNCNNIDDCEFLAKRRYGNFMYGSRCSTKLGLGRCCDYLTPRQPGVNAIIDDPRPISRIPKIAILAQNDTDYSTAECNVSSFRFGNYLSWSLRLKNGEIIGIPDYEQNLSRNDLDGTIIGKIKIPDELSPDELFCHAPFIGSDMEWRNGSYVFDELPEGDKLNSSTPALAAGLLTAGVAVLAIVTIGILFYLSLSSKDVLSKEDLQNFYVGMMMDPGQLDGEDNNAMPLVDILNLPYNKEFEYERNKFKFGKLGKLGEGAFGLVFRGLLTLKDGTIAPVAIKTINGSLTKDKINSLLAEIKILTYIGYHENVVGFLGAHTKELKRGKLLIATELCENGSLENFIRANKVKFNVFASETIFCLHTLMNWASGIADGMQYISEKKVVHVDLATRNVFLTCTLTPKIGDFGLSRKLYTKEIYQKKTADYLPIYWMSLESLTELSFSTQSDIWSYGVILWEMFSFCLEPYSRGGQQLSWDELVQFLSMGKRLSKPPQASSEVYEKMLQCWNVEPLERPTFSTMSQFFDGQLSNCVCAPFLKTQEVVKVEMNGKSVGCKPAGYMSYELC